MKKLITLLLVLALVVPMGLTANATDPAYTEKPFYGLGWSDFENQQFPYMEGLATLNIGNVGDIVNISYGGAKISANNIDDEQVTKMATALKKTMDARPQGMRYIHFFGPSKALGLAPDDVIYLDHGVDQLKAINEALFAKLYDLGGQVDGAMMSMLYTGMSSYYINTNDAKDDNLIYNKIVNNPLYKTEVRPLLEERGFKFYEKITPYTPEIYGISGKAGAAYSTCQAIWDTVMRNRLNAYITEWCYAPMAKYFPDVYVSDYQSPNSQTWVKGVSNDGDVGGNGGNAIKAGNTSCQNFYAGRPTGDFYSNSGAPVYKDIPTHNSAVYEETSFNCFLYDMNVSKRVYAADELGNVCYWISRGDTGTDDNKSIVNTPYYAEQAFHLNLYDPKPFVVFLYRGYFDTQEEFDKSCSLVNELLAEVSRVAGFSDRKPISLPQNWNSEFVISGMYAGGRNIWRITPNRDVVSKADFLINSENPTFRAAGQTVTFPGGKIIEDTPINGMETVGYWVETAADVTPIVENDADRFQQYPTYLEDYESYAVGTKLVSTNLRDLGAWIVQPKGNDLLVVEDGGDKALSVTGNSLLQSKLIPANVTLGDEYALDQVWEVTVTIPEGLSANAELTLLNFEGTKSTAKDGGFKLTGGKIHYSENGEYFELTDLVPGKYTFRRVMDFHQHGAYTCQYEVVTPETTIAKGSVAVPSFNGRVSAIGITCKNVNQRIILDDFTLRAAGAAADLYLYTADLGLKSALSAQHSQDMVYRLSWANASDKEETAKVMADIYEGDTLKEQKLLQELTLNPGYDGVEYGTVKVGEGQTVKIWLDTSVKGLLDPIPTEPTTKPNTEPTTNPGTNPGTNPTEAPATDATAAPTDGAAGDNAEKSGGSTMLIVVIGAVAVVAIVAAVLVFTKKKK